MIKILKFHRSFTTRAKGPKRAPSYIHNVGKHPLLYRTVGEQISLSAEKYADRDAIVAGNERLSFAEMKDQVDRIAAGFLAIGLTPGDRIGIWAPNTVNWYLNAMAAAQAGLVSVGINPAYQVPEVEYCIQKVGMKAIVCAERYRTQNYYEMLEQIIPEMKSSGTSIRSTRFPTLSNVIVDTNRSLKGTIKFDDIRKITSDFSDIAEIQSKIHADKCCNIQFTSGTTGKPKAAQLSHNNFINNGYHCGVRNELDVKARRICVQVPLFHAYGFVIGIMAGLIHGSTLVLPGPGFNAKESIAAIVTEQCDVIFGTPTMYVDLIDKLTTTGTILPNIDVVATGGSPCSPQLFKNIKEKLRAKKVKTVFGMTETTAVIFQALHEETEDHVLTTVGHVQDSIEAKVIDETGNTVPFGTSGELCVRGYVTMLGYYADEEKTKETIGDDRWLKTGDQFILREDGYGQIVGRIKELIIRGGENLFPKEIEDFLNTHPNILESYCVGVPDKRMGEEVAAFVRLMAGTSLDESELKQYCSGKIAHFKVPKYLRVVDTFPKTVSGKIQKFKLREMFEAEKEVKIKDYQ